MVDITPDTADVISRDGKLFALVGGLEIPLKISSEAKAVLTRDTRQQIRRELRNLNHSLLDIKM